MNRLTPSEKAESLSPSCSQKLVSNDESVLIDPRLRMAFFNVGLAPTGIFRQVVSLRMQGAQGQYGPLPRPSQRDGLRSRSRPASDPDGIVPGGTRDGGDGLGPPPPCQAGDAKPE